MPEPTPAFPRNPHPRETEDTMGALLRLVRVRQAAKNLFVFLPLFFGLELTDLDLLIRAAVAFVAFTLTAWAVYVFNDIQDVEADRRHPVKRDRPLASGEVSEDAAAVMAGTLVVASFALMMTVSAGAVWILALYAVLNGSYSLGLKHVPVLDVCIIALGYVLRVLLGGAATGIPLSAWIVVMTFLLALFLALAKRRDDVVLFLETGNRARKSIDGYNLAFLDSAMTIMAGVVIVAYVSYALAPGLSERLGTENFYLTTFFVVLGILRYLQVAMVEEKSGNPTEVLFRDHFLQLTLLGWLGTCLWLMYA
jgi:4-hydroxybenzoate polyprenyltransferase